MDHDKIDAQIRLNTATAIRQSRELLARLEAVVLGKHHDAAE